MDEAHAMINYKSSERFCRIVAVFFRLILWLALSVLFDETSYRKRSFPVLQDKTDVVHHVFWETVAP